MTAAAPAPTGETASVTRLEAAALAYVGARDAIGAADPGDVRAVVDRELAAGALLDAAEGLVRRNASRYWAPHVPDGELVAAGRAAVIRAAESYDPDQALFTTHLGRRLSGAMVDAVRRFDSLSRDDRRRVATVHAAHDRAEGERGRTPTDEEVAAVAGVSVEAVRRSRLLAQRRYPAEPITAPGEPPASAVDRLVAACAAPDSALDAAQVAHLVRALVTRVGLRLSPKGGGGGRHAAQGARRVQEVFRRHIAGQRQVDIAADMGVSDARVSQDLRLARDAARAHEPWLADEIRSLLTR